MAPEQFRGAVVDRRIDVYGAAVVLWESLIGQRFFDGDNEGVIFSRVFDSYVDSLSRWAPDLPYGVDEVVMCGLERNPDVRYQSAKEMSVALEDTLGLASPRHVGEWVEHVAGEALAR